jgi:hypothetical protein
MRRTLLRVTSARVAFALALGTSSLPGILSCATPSAGSQPEVQLEAPPPEPAATAKPKSEEEQRKEKEAQLVELIADANLVEMTTEARAKVRAETLAELAEVRFEGGQFAPALETIEKAAEEADDAKDTQTRATVDRSAFVIMRFVALEEARAGRFDKAMSIFDKMMLRRSFSRAQKEQIGGERLLVIETRGDNKIQQNLAIRSALARIIGPGQTAPATGAAPGFDWTAGDLRNAMATKGGKDDLPQANLPSTGLLAETGNFDPTTVLRVVSANKRSVTSCYARSLKGEKPKKGKLEILATIATTGIVTASVIDTAEFKGTELGRCISEAVGRWRFPPFRGNESRRVLLPFLLQFMQ